MKFGEIVLARFPFTDLTGAKRRPALVISNDPSKADCIVCFITSVPRSGPAMVPISPSGSNGLKAPSVVCFDKIATLNTAVISGTLGHASPDWLAAQSTRFFSVFGFQAP